MYVKVIEASKPETLGKKSMVSRKIPVAAYCRISTDKEEQEGSYEAQCRHYRELIEDNPVWTLAGIYADEGISGTSTRHREEFLRMIEDCKCGKIGLILTKSISRFARNTVDCLRYIRLLKDLGIPIFFQKESINTMDAKGEVLITIMASLAQEESQSISQNVRMGLQYRMQHGQGRFISSRFMGYRTDPKTGQLLIVPEDAVIIRRIFRMYLEGMSPGLIAARLTRDGIPTPTGLATWYASTIQSILVNEKYCGDLLLQKYYVPDCLTHKVVRNTGQLPQYYVENAHAPIVPRQIFLEVRSEKMRRSAFKSSPAHIRYGSENVFSRRVICGKCGREYKRCSCTDDGQIYWQCRRRPAGNGDHLSKSHCGARTVSESDLTAAVLAAFNSLPSRTSALENNLHSLTALPPSPETSHQIFMIRMLLEFIEIEIHAAARQDDTATTTSASAACSDYQDFLHRTRSIPPHNIFDDHGHMIHLDHNFAIRYIDKIVIRNDTIEIHFKAGITIP